LSRAKSALSKRKNGRWLVPWRLANAGSSVVCDGTGNVPGALKSAPFFLSARLNVIGNRLLGMIGPEAKSGDEPYVEPSAMIMNIPTGARPLEKSLIGNTD